MTRFPIRAAFAAVLMTASLAGTAMAQPPYAPIPELRFERVPPVPRGPRVVWEPGHWHWNGRHYVWFGGRYVGYRPNYGHYEVGHWADRGGRWVWVPAHWQ